VGDALEAWRRAMDADEPLSLPSDNDDYSEEYQQELKD
jgi:hypothetical protein